MTLKGTWLGKNWMWVLSILFGGLLIGYGTGSYLVAFGVIIVAVSLLDERY